MRVTTGPWTTSDEMGYGLQVLRTTSQHEVINGFAHRVNVFLLPVINISAEPCALIALAGDTLAHAHPDPRLHLHRPWMTLKTWVFYDKR